MLTKLRWSALPHAAFTLVLASTTACSGSSSDASLVGTDDAGSTDAASAHDAAIAIEASLTDSSAADALADGTSDADATTPCMSDAGAGPVQRVCVHFGADDDECDGHHDVATFPANGIGGNGFDDDCDGLVDEGCGCTAIGATKECYLVPASQTALAKPVGWCAHISRGTVDCVKRVTDTSAHWSGQCRGAQPPLADDLCAPGDFDCDGKEQNSKTQDCVCDPGTVLCPTTVLETIPYPPPSALPLQVDATTWFKQPSDAALATGWKWTLRGGDCDNVLPHPTFGIYTSANGTGVPPGIQSDTLGSTGKEHGIVMQAQATAVYPAFALSGDYLLEGELDLRGRHTACVVKIRVRAPGIRTEACWDLEGNAANHADLDLHVAKINGFAQCPTSRGWGESCASEDCYYANCKSPTLGMAPAWYADSPASACVGWGSASTGATCGNPRLDRDVIACDRAFTNPNDTGSPGMFCGAENVNIDQPVDGDSYAVSMKYYGGLGAAKARVNVYCDGARVMASGYDPLAANDYPQLSQAGSNDTGDMWKVGAITAHVAGGVVTCSVSSTQSQTPHPATDGSNAYCVDNTTTDTPDCTKYLMPGGLQPIDANAMCFH